MRHRQRHVNIQTAKLFKSSQRQQLLKWNIHHSVVDSRQSGAAACLQINLHMFVCTAVCGHVSLERAGMSEVLATNTAGVRFLTSVHTHMCLQITRLGECPMTNGALPRPFVRVQRSNVPQQLASVPELL